MTVLPIVIQFLILLPPLGEEGELNEIRRYMDHRQYDIHTFSDYVNAAHGMDIHIDNENERRNEGTESEQTEQTEEVDKKDNSNESNEKSENTERTEQTEQTDQKQQKEQTAQAEENKQAEQKQPATYTFEVTAYTAGAESTGKSPGDDGYGITASGETVTDGVTVACPPSMAFGTRLRIEGVGERVCHDRGGHITEGRLDVYIPNLAEARNFGRRQLEVKILN